MRAVEMAGRREMSVVESRYELTTVVADLGTSRIFEATPYANDSPVYVQVIAKSDEELAALREPLEKAARAVVDAGLPGRPIDWDVSTQPGWIAYDHHGEPLAAAVRRTRDTNLADSVAIDLSSALEILHKAGLTHRALNPRTVFHGDRRVAVLGLDALRAPGPPANGDGGPANDPRYTAPEAFDGGGDIKADVYSLGCIIFALLTGAPPFFGNAAQLREAHRTQPVPTVPGDDAVAWNALLARLLAKDPAARPLPGEIAGLVRRKRGHSYAPTALAAPSAGRSRGPIVFAAGTTLLLVAIAAFGATSVLAPSDPVARPSAAVPAASAPAAAAPAASAPAAAAAPSAPAAPAATPAPTRQPTPAPAAATVAPAPAVAPPPTAAPAPAGPISRVAPGAGPRGTLFRIEVGPMPAGQVFWTSYSTASGFESPAVRSGVVGADGVVRTTLQTSATSEVGPYAFRIFAGGQFKVVTFQVTP